MHEGRKIKILFKLLVQKIVAPYGASKTFVVTAAADTPQAKCEWGFKQSHPSVLLGFKLFILDLAATVTFGLRRVYGGSNHNKSP